MQVKVHAEVVNPKDETRETTNDFYFTFNTRNKDVPSVIPKTYAGKYELHKHDLFCKNKEILAKLWRTCLLNYCYVIHVQGFLMIIS